MQYRLKRERRKSFKIEIHNDEVVVKAPFWVSKSSIETFVHTHRSWIEEAIRKKLQTRRKFEFGETFLLLGERYPLYKGTGKLCFHDGVFWSKEPNKEAFRSFYKDFAKKYIYHRTEQLASKYNCLYNGLKITSAKKRWGSCTSKKNLNFSYRTVMLPPELIDYIIIHELSHLMYMNHSKEFWRLVEKRMPDYKERHKRLATFLVDDI
ncbi:M48 family metallopeptidase [Nitratiruptor sp. SB155-2]|uniref:M48 family metallopeptidase n=1 Tax=Nitratiruptor sp. (strain SB155-2) TaxID=387092 RepID=UPI0001586F42|nr:SprT family zinc-dependent metalloprotease [Nitratiruptor sp. SB155-2]BAF69269.1 conserved hypothetical protein [Nitratiruptor sp. SB155-2]